MTEQEVVQKVKEAIDALDNYNKDIIGNKILLTDIVKRELPTLLEKCYAIGASGKICPACNGSGRQ